MSLKLGLSQIAMALVACAGLNAASVSVVKTAPFGPTVPTLLPDDLSLTYTYISDAGGNMYSDGTAGGVGATIATEERIVRNKTSGGPPQETIKGNFQNTLKQLRDRCQSVNITLVDVNANWNPPSAPQPGYQSPVSDPGTAGAYAEYWPWVPFQPDSDILTPPQTVNITSGGNNIGYIKTASRKWTKSYIRTYGDCTIVEQYAGFGNYYKIEFTLTKNGATTTTVPFGPIASGVEYEDSNTQAAIISTGFDVNSRFKVDVMMKAGYNTTIQSSPDLTSWTSYSISGGAGGIVPFTDNFSAPYSARFYRLICSAQNSPDTVGFVRAVQYAGSQHKFFSMPFIKGQNTPNDVIDSKIAGLKVGLWNPATASYTYSEYNGSTWSNPNLLLTPGNGFIQTLPTPYTQRTQRLHGFVRTGASLVNPLNSVSVLKGSIVPKAGLLTSLSFIPVDGDSVQKWNEGTQSFQSFDYVSTTWIPSSPAVILAEGFYVFPASYRNWTQSYFSCP